MIRKTPLHHNKVGAPGSRDESPKGEREHRPQARRLSGQVSVFFKSCVRCLGDRILEEDMYGLYMLCLACGYVTYPEVKAVPRPALQGAGLPA